MPAIPQGFKLVQALKASGTGQDKIKLCQAVLLKNRQATSADIVAALEADITVSVVTIDKAKQLAATGKYDPAAGRIAALSIEDQIAAEEAAGGSIDLDMQSPAGSALPNGPDLTPAPSPNSNTVELQKIGVANANGAPPAPANKVELKKVEGQGGVPPAGSALPS